MDTNCNNFDNEIKIYKYRWVILLIFCLYAFINFLQYLQYSIIRNIIVRYYNVDDFLVSLTSLLFLISFLVFFLPVNYLIQLWNLKIIAIIGSGLTALGNLTKLLSVSPDRIYVALFGQLICGIAQVFIISIPTKVASKWFGASQVSTACAIAIFGTQIGVAVGSLVSPALVKNHANPNDIGDDLFQMLLYNAITSCVIFLIVLLFFRSKPEQAPSHSQLLVTNDAIPFKQILMGFIKNRNYLWIVLAFGVTNGIWNCLGILFNDIYLSYFPNSESGAGLCAFLAIISGGCIGSLVFGFILDKTHKFKLVSFLSLFLSGITLVILLSTLFTKLQLATYFTVSLFGFFIASTLVIGFEYAVEMTYPMPEAAACAVLNAVSFIFGIIFTLLFNFLFDSIGYIATGGLISGILLACSALIYFVSPNLLRRDANIVTPND